MKQKKIRYSKNYFINFYSKIPAKKWICGDYQKTIKGEVKCCAVGFLQNSETKINDLNHHLGIHAENINDDIKEYGHLGKHPKTRIVNALKRRVKGQSIEKV